MLEFKYEESGGLQLDAASDLTHVDHLRPEEGPSNTPV